MAKYTTQDIWKTADDLDAAGQKPTHSAIRKAMGGGSFTTISDAMVEWRKRKDKSGQSVTEPLPAPLLDAATQLVSEIWRTARANADQIYSADRDQFSAEVAELQAQAKELAELADTQSAEIDSLQIRLEAMSALQAERDRLASELQQQRQAHDTETRNAQDMAAQKDAEVKAARQSERSALDRAAKADGQIEALTNQLAQMTVALSKRDED